jgi:hypothetical protein
MDYFNEASFTRGTPKIAVWYLKLNLAEAARSLITPNDC